MAESQHIKAGDHAYNIQVGRDINVSTLSYSDVKEIASDVFKQNFIALRGQAFDVAFERADELLDLLLKKLNDKGVIPDKVAIDPDVQYAVFDAQKAYARSGDEEQAKTLVDILIQRFQTNDRTTLQLVLNESLHTVPKLNKHHMDLLTLVWVMRYLTLKGETLAQLLMSYYTMTEPFTHDLKLDDSSYIHLQYAACGGIDMGSATLERILTEKYPTHFNERPTGVSASKLFSDFHRSLDALHRYWEATPASSFTLTSVGVAIARAHFCVAFPNDDMPLSIWIK